MYIDWEIHKHFRRNRLLITKGFHEHQNHPSLAGTHFEKHLMGRGAHACQSSASAEKEGEEAREQRRECRERGQPLLGAEAAAEAEVTVGAMAAAAMEL